MQSPIDEFLAVWRFWSLLRALVKRSDLALVMKVGPVGVLDSNLWMMFHVVDQPIIAHKLLMQSPPLMYHQVFGYMLATV